MKKLFLGIGLTLTLAVLLMITFMVTNALLTMRNLQLGAEYNPNRPLSIPARVLSPSSNNQREPFISGSRVVWTEKIGDYWQIILFDLTDNSRHQLTSDSSDHVYPSISGDNVIWWQGEPGDAKEVSGINYASGQMLKLPNVRVARPTIDGTRLVWSSEANTFLLSSIVYFDLENQEAETLTQAKGANWPVLSNDIVVWEDWRNGTGDIYAYSLMSNQELPITQAMGDQEKPDISGEIVVWQDNRNSKAQKNNYDIYAYDLREKREFIISARGGREVDPKISGEIVVWTDYVGSYVDIYAYDLNRQALLTVAADDHANGQPSVSETTVIWTRWETADRNAHSQIMIGQIPVGP